MHGAPKKEAWVRYLLYVLLAALTATSVHRTAKTDLDFKVFYGAGRRLVDGDRNLYDFRRDGVFTFKYSPFFPVLMLPFSALPEKTSRLLWGLSSALAFLLAWFAFIRYLELGNDTRSVWAQCLTLLLVAQPVTNNAIQGNINALLLALMALALFLDQKANRPICAGILLALAISTKLTPAALGFYWLCRKRYRALSAATLFSLVFMILVPVLLYGTAGACYQYEQWLTVLKDTAHFPFYKYTNQSPFVVAYHFSQSTGWARVFHSLMITLFVATLLFFCWSRLWLSVLSTCFFLMLVVPPVSWIDYYLFLTFPLLWIHDALFHGKLGTLSKVIYFVRFGATGFLVQAFVGREWSDFFAYYGLQFWGLCALLLILSIEAINPSSPYSRAEREKTLNCAQ
ncbi:MAG: DUF2029 domain-containing protein [Bdellovibrionales bacterium]|nr:DUF2029 domain-containing protein [Bdellovibrionales bacterium]